MSHPGKKVQVIVGGQCWRVEAYHERTCTEYLVRGPWSLAQTAWRPDGKPRWMRGHVTCWKMVGGKPMAVNRNKSRKNRIGDPDGKNMPDWQPFYEAWQEVVQ